MGGGGGWGGGMGGGMHSMAAMGGGMGAHPMQGTAMHPSGVTSFSAVRPAASFAAMPTTPHFTHSGFRNHHHFFHHRRFFFVGGAPYYYDYGYDDCLRQIWTGYGVRWVNVCGDYGY